MFYFYICLIQYLPFICVFNPNVSFLLNPAFCSLILFLIHWLFLLTLSPFFLLSMCLCLSLSLSCFDTNTLIVKPKFTAVVCKSQTNDTKCSLHFSEHLTVLRVTLLCPESFWCVFVLCLHSWGAEGAESSAGDPKILLWVLSAVLLLPNPRTRCWKGVCGLFVSWTFAQHSLSHLSRKIAWFRSHLCGKFHVNNSFPMQCGTWQCSLGIMQCYMSWGHITCLSMCYVWDLNLSTVMLCFPACPFPQNETLGDSAWRKVSCVSCGQFYFSEWWTKLQQADPRALLEMSTPLEKGKCRKVRKCRNSLGLNFRIGDWLLW